MWGIFPDQGIDTSSIPAIGDFGNNEKQEIENMAYETPLTIFEVVQDISANKYILPSIQREFTWSTSQIEQLFDSRAGGSRRRDGRFGRAVCRFGRGGSGGGGRR